MKSNKAKKVPNMLVKKPKTAYPRYGSSKALTLKELMNEVDKQEDEMHDGHVEDADHIMLKSISTRDFTNNPREPQTIQKLRQLTESEVKPPEPEKAPNLEILERNQMGTYKERKDARQPIKKKVSDEKPNIEHKRPKDNLKSIRNFEDRTKQFEERKKEKQRKIEKEMQKVCSFKPQVNKKSALLDRQRHAGRDREVKEAKPKSKQPTQKVVFEKNTTNVNKLNKFAKPLKDVSETIKEKAAKLASGDSKYAIARLYRSCSERNMGLNSLRNTELV